jgi:bifunctional DNA-binding transcriptional regulator/antitoxin component of YhaV-PrlF toxin-antitoxin module
MMPIIKLTSKRQATFPKQLCEELGVHSGDGIEVSRRNVNGKTVWCLMRTETERPRWFGKFRKYAVGKSHAMKDIRASIERARKRG